ncbi:glycosyltransferase [Candidatus Berkelbacteria bacterium]|nr:glycosyltransferase [Candidatus Berkelbacteria bacterium]
MRIAITTESYYPNVSGVAVFAHYLAKNMAARGHKVVVICPGSKHRNTIERGGKNLTIYRLKSLYNPFRKGYRYTLMPQKAVWQILDEFTPDVIHAQDPAAISLAASGYAKRHHIRLVITNHFFLDYVTSYIKLPPLLSQMFSKTLARYLAWFYNRADVITCPTKTVKSYLKKFGITPPVEAISNGVNLEQFFPHYGKEQMRRRYGVPVHTHVVLYTGRLDKDKRVSILVKTIPLILRELDAYFIICGNGKQKSKLMGQIAELGLEHDTKIIGFIGHEKEMPRIYQMADVFATPSPIETQGIVVLEAMASGLPVVGASAGALPEAIKHGENGYLFEPGNIDDFARNIIKILKNKTLAKRMGETGLQMVEKHMLSRTYDAFEKIYSDRTSR